ncbi:cyclin-like f-box [Trichoderma cornu-damae]|uniref:Cyclin-like f-box n=1 Tax=Trichoderma cornu-damae TaxID=654480 RepID=A0A9P8QRA6_9HYPO|nr:cyclin-like f-box [Trichoderma cornu-damae]
MARLNPATITSAPGQQPFTLQPLIRDMLRTRRCRSGSIFIVEGIDVIPVPAATPGEDDTHAMRLVLGDGELCIQALLHPDMFDLVQRRDVFVGCCVRLGDYMVRLEEPEESGAGGNLFEERDEEDKEEEEEEEEREKEQGESEGEKAMAYLVVNALETAGWSEAYMAMWRRHDEDRGVERPSPITADSHTKTEVTREDRGPLPDEAQTTPKASKSKNRSVRFADMQTSPSAQTPTKAKAHDKGKARPSHLPPGKQRTARIADPSTAKQVHLTVFLDPDGFTPRVGSAVLLVGVKNHRFDGGSLKKYASDGERDIGKRWWFEDPWELEWLDVAGIKSWWKGMEEYYGQSGSERNAE